MPIKPSSSSQIDNLIGALASESPIEREAAVARLTLAGARAVPRLIAVLESEAAARARVAALRILEAVTSPTATEAVLSAIDSSDADVAAAAIAAAAPRLGGRDGPRVTDRLTTVALDTSKSERLRLAAIRALKALNPGTVAPLIDALTHDTSGRIREAARTSAADPSAVVATAALEQLPEEPAELLVAIDEAGPQASLSELVKVIDRIREREREAPKGLKGDRLVEWRMAWMRVRGRAHAALAARGSRVALYDLRESLEGAAGPLPIEFISAVTRIGEQSSLEPLAAAYERTTDGWWREQLAGAFRAIVKREKITRRSAALKRLAKRHPGSAADLMPA